MYRTYAMQASTVEDMISRLNESTELTMEGGGKWRVRGVPAPAGSIQQQPASSQGATQGVKHACSLSQQQGKPF